MRYLIAILVAQLLTPSTNACRFSATKMVYAEGEQDELRVTENSRQRTSNESNLRQCNRGEDDGPHRVAVENATDVYSRLCQTLQPFPASGAHLRKTQVPPIES